MQQEIAVEGLATMMGDPLIIEARADGSLMRLFQVCQRFSHAEEFCSSFSQMGGRVGWVNV